MQIHLKGQSIPALSEIKLCDSSISVCPKTFDYLIKQDALAKKYSDNYTVCNEEKINLLHKIAQKDGIIEGKQRIIKAGEELVSICALEKSAIVIELKKAEKTIARKTVWQWVLGITGVAGIIFVAVQK